MLPQNVGWGGLEAWGVQCSPHPHAPRFLLRGAMGPHELPPASVAANGQPWWRELNRYHWFVFLVASLGWLFDTMDQQLFNIARRPAIRALLEQPKRPESSEPGRTPTEAQIAEYEQNVKDY